MNPNQPLIDFLNAEKAKNLASIASSTQAITVLQNQIATLQVSNTNIDAIIAILSV